MGHNHNQKERRERQKKHVAGGMETGSAHRKAWADSFVCGNLAVGSGGVNRLFGGFAARAVVRCAGQTSLPSDARPPVPCHANHPETTRVDARGAYLGGVALPMRANVDARSLPNACWSAANIIWALSGDLERRSKTPANTSRMASSPSPFSISPGLSAMAVLLPVSLCGVSTRDAWAHPRHIPSPLESRGASREAEYLENQNNLKIISYSHQRVCHCRADEISSSSGMAELSLLTSEALAYLHALSGDFSKEAIYRAQCAQAASTLQVEHSKTSHL